MLACARKVFVYTICSKYSPTFRLISHPPRTANTWNFRIRPASHVSQLTSNPKVSCTTKEKVTVNSTRKGRLHASMLRSTQSSATSILPSSRQLIILLQCIPCQTCCSMLLNTACKPSRVILETYAGYQRFSLSAFQESGSLSTTCYETSSRTVSTSDAGS